MKKTLFITLFFLVVILGIKNTQAFSISPSKILLTINPGDYRTVSINVTNDEGRDMYFVGQVFVVDQSNNGQPIFFQNNTTSKSWIVASDKKLIKKGEIKPFEFKINIPKNAYPGSYFFGLGIKSELEQAGIGLTGQIISILNLQVSGQAKEELIINKWELNKIKTTSDNYVFNLNLDNKSNVDINLSSKISLYNWQGKTISSQNQYLGNMMIPNTTRFLNPTIKDNKFNFSPVIKAKIDITYGRLNLQTTDQVLILNWTVIIIAIILGFLFILALILLIKRFVIHHN